MTKTGQTPVADESASALAELADEIAIVAAENKGEIIEAAALTSDDLERYYAEVERVVEAQQVAEDDATQLLLR